MNEERAAQGARLEVEKGLNHMSAKAFSKNAKIITKMWEMVGRNSGQHLRSHGNVKYRGKWCGISSGP